MKLLYRVSQCIFVLDLACKPWPASWHETGELEAHATCTWRTWASLCAEFVTDWLHLNKATYDSIIRACRSFAMIACKKSLMSVTGVGGKKSFIITSYLLIQWFKAAFHSTYGLQSINIHACAAAAIHSGSHVDGDAGDKLLLWITCYFNNQWNWELCAKWDIEPVWPIHEGNLFVRNQADGFWRWSHWCAHMSTYSKASAKAEEGNL